MTHPDSIPNFPPSLKKDHTKHLHIEYSCKWTESLSLCYYWTLLMINRTKRSLSVTATKLSPSFHYHFIAKPIIKRKLCLRNLLSKNWLDYLLNRKCTKNSVTNCTGIHLWKQSISSSVYVRLRCSSLLCSAKCDTLYVESGSVCDFT